MRCVPLIIMIFFSLADPAHATNAAVAPLSDAAQVMQAQIQTLASQRAPQLAGETLQRWAQVTAFYTSRHYEPAWRPQQIEALVQRVREADRAGLSPLDYHLAALEGFVAHATETPRHSVELLVTDAFLTYADHLAHGRRAPQRMGWHIPRTPVDIVARLREALEHNRIGPMLSQLAPTHAAYRGLRQALPQYRDYVAHGGWPHIAARSGKLVVGDSDPRLPVIRDRLAITGELAPAHRNQSLEYADPVAQAIRRFQVRHGLEVDGEIGSATIAAMNVSAEDRLRQILINLDRFRWLPRDLGEHFVSVNLPSATLQVIEGGHELLTMRTIVGRRDARNRTPILRSQIEQVILNPAWNIPQRIAQQEFLPALAKDPRYLQRRNITLVSADPGHPGVIDPETTDLSQLDPALLRLRQDPGRGNALGNVKFVFPNRFGVYLHDTSSRGLFAQATRTLSHGCVRVQDPIALASALLRGDPEWNRDRIERHIGGRHERAIRLPAPIPVYLLYLTAWTDPDGTLQFREDIYGYDRQVTY